MKTFVLKLDAETHTALKVRAAKEGKSMQDLINELLENFISQDE